MSWSRPDPELTLADEAVRLTPYRPAQDAAELGHAALTSTNGRNIFRYTLATPEILTLADFERFLEPKLRTPGWITLTVRSRLSPTAVGTVSLMNIRAEHGCLEVGSIWYTQSVQRTEVNTRTMALVFGYVFDQLKYRRLEWKCHNDNQPSKAAALRLGFVPEGVFRQHFWDKDENRDTAWYSLIDAEWPEKRQNLAHLIRKYDTLRGE